MQNLTQGTGQPTATVDAIRDHRTFVVHLILGGEML
jgi:hypothetical protein